MTSIGICILYLSMTKASPLCL